MRRFGTALLLAAVVCTLAAGAAHAAPRAYVGVLDDESLRWAPSASERIASWSLLQRDHASVVRTMVDWATIAQRRPANGASPFDPAYRWADLDDFVRNAQQRGIEVLLTLWGTPRWANGGKNPNVPPTDPRTFGRFAHAVAARYSGKPPADCLAFGVACGAESTDHLGAGIVEPRAVDRLLDDVDVRQLSAPTADVS